MEVDMRLSDMMAANAQKRQLVGDFGLGSCYHGPFTAHSDNKSAACICKNPITHKHSRHIDRRLHWLREKVSGIDAALRIAFIPTDQNVSDAFTKPNPKDAFRRHRDTLLNGFRYVLDHEPATISTQFLCDLQRDSDYFLQRDSGLTSSEYDEL